MNYKKLIPNQEVRIKILSLLDFLPDKLMIKIQYRIATGKKLNLQKPKRFTEKLQWYKLYYRDPLMVQGADKYSVRDFIIKKGYSEILVPIYGVYDDAEDIDFDHLPNKFVLKTTNGSHTNILCEDKSKLNIPKTRKIINKWLHKRSAKLGREWAYYNIKPRIICEKYIDKDKNGDLIDYKFYSHNGVLSYIKIVTDRFKKSGRKQGIFDLQFNQLPYYRDGVLAINKTLEKPSNYAKMVEIAQKISEDFPHVRVDLYNIDGVIYFGELTFYDTSGYETFTPDEFDFILGNNFKLPEKMK